MVGYSANAAQDGSSNGMTNRLRLLAAISAALALQPIALAGASAGEPKAKEAGNKADPDQKICRMETPTGSIRPIRTCRTRAEFEAEANRGQANKNEMDAERMRQGMVSGSRG